MNVPSNSRGWGQFSLRVMFVAVLVTAAFCGGYMLREDQVQQLTAQQSDLRRRNLDLEQRNSELQQEFLLQMVEQTASKVMEDLASTSVEQPDGRVVRVSPAGDVVWIDRGSADGLRRQQRFTVYDKQETDFQNATPKATIEIASVEGPDIAQARVVSKDENNPIVPQDIVFSPTWQPGQRLHFALAGKLDYNDDGVADNDLIRKVIRINGGIIDAEVDAQGRRTGTVSIRTRYLVVGDPLSDLPNSNVNHTYNELLSQAAEQSVEKVSVKNLLEMHSGPKTPGARSETAARFRPRGPGSGYP